MSINDSLNQVKKELDKMKRDRRFKKANMESKARADLLIEIANCNGILNRCMLDFSNIVSEQSRIIRKAADEGYDTTSQEQILWDAAIGYMLVRDCMFALKSVSSFDSLTRAYDSLNYTIKNISGSKSKSLKQIADSHVDKEAYQYLNSDDILAEKQQLLDSVFAELKLSGDIEACLKNMNKNKNANSLSSNKRKTELSKYDNMFSDDDLLDEDLDISDVMKNGRMSTSIPNEKKE